VIREQGIAIPGLAIEAWESRRVHRRIRILLLLLNFPLNLVNNFLWFLSFRPSFLKSTQVFVTQLALNATSRGCVEIPGSRQLN